MLASARKNVADEYLPGPSKPPSTDIVATLITISTTIVDTCAPPIYSLFLPSKFLEKNCTYQAPKPEPNSSSASPSDLQQPAHTHQSTRTTMSTDLEPCEQFPFHTRHRHAALSRSNHQAVLLIEESIWKEDLMGGNSGRWAVVESGLAGWLGNGLDEEM